MKIPPSKIIAFIVGASSLLAAIPALADSPAVAWAEYRMAGTVGDCIDSTTQAMEKQGIRLDPNYGRGAVVGSTDKLKVVTECFSVAKTTVVVVIVSGADETEANNTLASLATAIPNLPPNEFEL